MAMLLACAALLTPVVLSSHPVPRILVGLQQRAHRLIFAATIPTTDSLAAAHGAEALVPRHCSPCDLGTAIYH